ncbi:hypothetical protein K439DRAFT_1382683 [Ramaria rubella]|nr:hypothetical protein K439DRAFT_1382683 [Ramaria rubella]
MMRGRQTRQQRDNLAKQLDELFRLRQTEPEKLLTEQKTQYEAQLKACDDTIQELQASLSRVDALSQSGGTTSLHFLTRETAEEEKQDVQREVLKLKKSLQDKEYLIAEKDSKIRELDDLIQVLRADLKAEIENTKALGSRNVPSSASKQNSKSADPKIAMVIRLYEELTGILITSVKYEPGMYKEESAVYTCVQTTTNNKSLNFTLKFFQEIVEDTPSNSKEQVVDKVIYTPQLLDQESEEFVAQLDFLAGPFTFQKAQMNVFTKTLTSYLEGDSEGDEQQSQVEVGEDD